MNTIESQLPVTSQDDRDPTVRSIDPLIQNVNLGGEDEPDQILSMSEGRIEDLTKSAPFLNLEQERKEATAVGLKILSLMEDELTNLCEDEEDISK